jgi:uncharacterized protein (TIGR00369 family)
MSLSYLESGNISRGDGRSRTATQYVNERGVTLTSRETVTMPPLKRRPGGPERLFGVRMALDPHSGSQAGTTVSGAWMRGPDGMPSSAALGVLIDDTLGGAASVQRPDGLWAVTTELSIDYPTPPTCDGQVITSRGGIVSVHSRGALATGSVEDDSGRTLAVMTLRSRYVPGVPEIPDGTGAAQPSDPSEAEAPRRESLLSLLNASISSDDRQVRLRVPEDAELTNASGVMHGGIALCASQLAASRWLSAEEDMTLASTRITYLRPLEIDGGIEFVARVVHAGRTFRLVEVTAHGPSGKLCTTATVAGYTEPGPRPFPPR